MAENWPLPLRRVVGVAYIVGAVMALITLIVYFER